MTHKVTDETRKMAENAAGIGVPQDDIATLLGITAKTLRKRYRKELAMGMAKANVQAGQMMYKRMLAGSDTMLIWWSKTRMGFKEDRSLELKTPPGQPLEHRHTYGSNELLGDFYRRQAAAVQPGPVRPGPDELPAEALSGGGHHLGVGDPEGDES